jgi:hypothetical protein
MFLTPRSGDNTLRFAIKNGGSEQRVETTQLDTGQWVHVAVKLKNDNGRIFINGVSQATSTSITINPSDFNPTINYIGKSQWTSDPLFDGRVDDFRIYNYGLTGDEIEALASPEFTSDTINNLDGLELDPYIGNSLASYANNPANIFSKDAGPDWLIVASDGTLSGVPFDSDVGENVFTVRIENQAGLYDTAQMIIQVNNIYSGTQGMEDLAGLASQWFVENCTDTPACDGADLDGDNDVTILDLLVMANNWLADETSHLYLKFDETSGDIARDSSVNQRDGSLINGPVWSSGYLGGALDFDGTDDYVEVTGYKGITGTASRTCCAWIKTTDTDAAILSWGDRDTSGARWVFKINSTGAIRVSVGGGNIIGSEIVTDDTWHHVAAVLVDDGSPNSDEIRLYVDGVEDTNTTAVSQAIAEGSVNADVLVGAFSSGNYCDGLIDDVRIYDFALSEQEIQSLSQ